VGRVITGVHTLVYSEDPDVTLAFFRDVIGWPYVEPHDGWLIFGAGPSELAVHPTDGGPLHHEISLMCDDLTATMAELSAKGAQFVGDVTEQRWGRVATLDIPAAGTMLLYQPTYRTALDAQRPGETAAPRVK
jgi:predicted enzyme related to lactoylglutathione lyase